MIERRLGADHASKPDWYEIDDNLKKFVGDYIADE